MKGIPMTTASTDEKLPLDWELVSREGPALTNHAGCLLRNTFYIHGGVTKYGSTVPSNKLYKLDLSSSHWVEVTAAGSPALSHHACVAIDNRYLILIGGWDGRQRVSHVHVFDTQENIWIPARDSGFPDGAGLSSHAAVVLSSGEILIVGREGSLRIQRKHGNVYLLTGNVLNGHFTYKKMTNATSSRSGHSINSVGNTLYIIGGRDDQLVEFHTGYSSGEPIGSITSKFSDIAQSFKPMSKPPSGRKHHVSISGKGCIVLHGGETFDGRSREPVGEMFLIKVKPHLQFYKLGVSAVGRACHVCVSSGDDVFFHGGIAGRNIVQSDTYRFVCRK
ncbi:kelch domain-containing protein 9-like isoform X1 [Mya arenaria]|uniref:kelch domain-containing protein 9-like isoform X1 n=1 Tax=Mya arenaria TaxID=6604 RepID=UPI0022DF3031|nr:kelch domain-containing protein 9-like isoform X1 [Mya arenaria]